MNRLFQQYLSGRRSNGGPAKLDLTDLDLHVESLESRLLLAGDVSVSVDSGDLVIEGDRFDNQLTLSVESGNIVLIADDDTTVNGENGPFVVLEGGTAFEGSVIGRLHGGDDQFIIEDGITFNKSVRLRTGYGDDTVGIAGSEFEQKLKIVTHAGDDTIAIQDATVERLRLSTRMGSDTISILDTDVATRFVTKSGMGSDTVVIDTVAVDGNLRTGLGAGADTLVIQDSDIGGRLKVFGRLGADFVLIESNTVADQTAIWLGFGRDALQLVDNDFADDDEGSRVARGGWGADSIDSDADDGVIRTISFKSDEVDDELATERLDDEETGAFAKAETALEIFDGAPPEQLSLTADFGLDAVSEVNGLIVMDQSQFRVEGSSTPFAQVAVSTGSDGIFDDGTVTVDSDGQFSLLVPLEDELDVTEVQVRATSGTEETVESAEVFYAVDTDVRFETSLGNIDVELLAEDAPLTVRNFLSYLDQFEDLIVHRAPDDFVVQSGGFRFDGGVSDVDTTTPVANEFNPANSNLRGTLSMALLGGQPESGTSGWFFNTVDNAFLDNAQHTVFGRVSEDSLAVIDAINDLPVFDLQDIVENGAFGETPLRDYSPFSEQLAGTLVVNSGSTQVTGLGTSFLSEIPADNLISVDGQIYEVASIESDTSLTLAEAAIASETDTGSVNLVPDADNFVIIDVAQTSGGPT